MEQAEHYDGSSGSYVTYDVPQRPEHYARRHIRPDGWSQETVDRLDAQLARRRAPAISSREAAESYERALDELARSQYRLDALQYQRDVADLDMRLWASRRAINCWGQEQYAGEPPLAVHAEQLDDRGDDGRDTETERAQALLDLAKLIENYGYSFADARRMARTPVSQLSGDEQSVAGLMRELLAVRSTSSRPVGGTSSTEHP